MNEAEIRVTVISRSDCDDFSSTFVGFDGPRSIMVDLKIPYRISHFFNTCILQYRHLIPAAVDRTPTSTWLHKHP